ncbi:MAG TPA: efflux RND transporter periplasmic adaptor subunit [Gemmatimonadaceae bacterium]|nr:efflux RND transporter periplasmic adaptor subunit [Gemmatimonadaceae bacterium]
MAPAPSHQTEQTSQLGAPDPNAPLADASASKRVYISPARQQLIGVRTAEVTHQALETSIRTVGVIAYDETRVAEIHAKIAGWAETVSVDFVGKQVQKGQPLFTIYSPDLVATQREYLLALKADRQLSSSPIEETREGARSLLAATRERLRLWDVTDAQVEELSRSGEPQRILTVYSPFTGVVLERNAFPGQYITPEMATFKIADLSTLWVLGQVFEYELGLLKLGQPAAIEFPYGQTTRRLSGRITFVYPDIDPQTRRAKVRVEFRNPGLEFKPGSFVTVIINASGGHQLAVPREAVIDTGTERYALLALPDGYFEPRPVTVGAPVNQYYPVLDGLQHGDRVVTSAQFLIDSETNLQAAMQSMVGHGHTMTGEVGKNPAPDSPTMPGMDHSKPKQ